MRLLSGLLLFALLGFAAAADTPQQLATNALQQPNSTCQSVHNEKQCHATYVSGCAKPGGLYDPYLDFFKNQLPATDSQPAEAVDPAKLTSLESQTPSALTEGNHKDFSKQFVSLNEGEIVYAVGYLYYAQQTGAESSNCYLTGTTNVDFHIGIGFDSGRVAEAKSKPSSKSAQFLDLQANSMIVEMTPHYRAQLEPKWSLTGLNAAYGMQVKVVGQLIADNDHHAPTDDCALSDHTSTCWRLSIWEIHPVTAFYVCTASSPCSATDTAGWTMLEDWKASAGSGSKHPKKKSHSPPA